MKIDMKNMKSAIVVTPVGARLAGEGIRDIAIRRQAWLLRAEGISA
jgi:hypothetical protein